MSNFNFGKSRFSKFVNGKGFYIALALCLVAIGSAAYIAVNGNYKNLDIKKQSATSSQTGGDTESTQPAENTVSGVPKDSSSSEPTSSISTAISSSTSSAASKASAAAPTLYVLPVQGDTITDYSPEKPLYDKTMNDWRTHNGIDITGDVGTPVKACADGTVLDVKVDSMLGQEVIVQHGGGLQSIYADLTNQVSVKKGQTVQAGTVLGAIGQTAQGESALVPHLHFEIMKNGEEVDPMVTMGKK